MKPIETKWKGWRFRSRTEARWAVFLDAAGIKFDYEPEGVLLPSGPYLPDFRLRDFEHPSGFEEASVWLEIKGGEATETERLKCAELALASGEVVLLAEGAPDFTQQVWLFEPGMAQSAPSGITPSEWSNLISLFIGPLAVMNFGGPEVDAIVAARGPRTTDERALGREHTLTPEEETAFVEAHAMFDGIYCWILGLKQGRVPSDQAYIGLGETLKAAYDKARSARFEFGETEKRWPEGGSS
jgi:hypothetical protein